MWSFLRHRWTLACRIDLLWPLCRPIVVWDLPRCVTVRQRRRRWRRSRRRPRAGPAQASTRCASSVVVGRICIPLRCHWRHAQPGSLVRQVVHLTLARGHLMRRRISVGAHSAPGERASCRQVIGSSCATGLTWPSASARMSRRSGGKHGRPIKRLSRPGQ